MNRHLGWNKCHAIYFFIYCKLYSAFLFFVVRSLLWHECKRSASLPAITATTRLCVGGSNTQSNDKKMAVDKFAFSFDLFNNFTKYTLNPEFDTQFGLCCSQQSKEKEKLLPNHWFHFIPFWLWWNTRLTLFTLSSILSASLSFTSMHSKSFINSVWPSSNFNCICILYLYARVSVLWISHCIFVYLYFFFCTI